MQTPEYDNVQELCRVTVLRNSAFGPLLWLKVEGSWSWPVVPAGAVAVVKRGVGCVVEPESLLLGGDLGLALIQVSVDGAGLLHSCGGGGARDAVKALLIWCE